MPDRIGATSSKTGKTARRRASRGAATKDLASIGAQAIPPAPKPTEKTMNQHVDRRTALSAIPVMDTASIVSADAVPVDSPILRLFCEWEATYAKAATVEPESEAGELLARCNVIEKKMISLPTSSAADFAAKIIVFTGYGGFSLESDKGSPLIKEAKALVAKARSHVEPMKRDSSADPLLRAIEEWRAGDAAYPNHPLAKKLDATQEELDIAVAETYGPADTVLRKWDRPAVTFEGAMAALKLVREEAIDNMMSCSEVLNSMLDAAIAYFDGRATVEPVVSDFETLIERFPAAAEPAPTEVEELFGKWLAVANGPQDPAEDDNWGESRYVRLQASILAAEPVTARDVAIQFFVDCDQFGSDFSDHFEALVKRLIGPIT